jgi:site-specific recombinase XerD
MKRVKMSSKRRKYPKRKEFLQRLKDLHRSQNTIDSYDFDMQLFFKYSKGAFTQDIVQDFILDRSSKGKNPNTLHRNLYAISTYAFIFDVDFDSGKVMRPKAVVKHIQHVTEAIFNAGISEISSLPKGSRYCNGSGRGGYSRRYKKLLFTLLYTSGLRVNELLSLNKSFIDFDSGILTIIGKGGKARKVPVLDDVLSKLEEDQFFVFLSGLKYQALYTWSKKYFGKDITPHCFRHGYATRLINNGVREATIQSVLGHTSYATTLRYFHTQETQIREDVFSAFANKE